jgi:hypothetical protein
MALPDDYDHRRTRMQLLIGGQLFINDELDNSSSFPLKDRIPTDVENYGQSFARAEKRRLWCAFSHTNGAVVRFLPPGRPRHMARHVAQWLAILAHCASSTHARRHSLQSSFGV